MSFDMKNSFEWIIKDNLFHRAVAGVRNRATAMINNPDAIAMIKENAARNLVASALEPVASGAAVSASASPQQLAASSSGMEESAERMQSAAADGAVGTATLPTSEEMEKLVFFDRDTAAMSFRMTLRTLARELNRSKQLQRPIAIAVLGLDDSEQASHIYGAGAITEVMKLLCVPALEAARCDIDVVGRYTESRLLLIWPETTTNNALKNATMLMKHYPVECKYKWQAIKAFVSIGVAVYPDHGTDVEELIGMADFACDLAQGHGGKKVMLSPSTTG